MPGRGGQAYVRFVELDLGHGQQRTAATAAGQAVRRWAVAEDLDAVRAVLWGDFGVAEAGAIDERFAALPAGHAPVVLDLTGVTTLEDAAVVQLGDWHEQFALIVVAAGDGRVHERLTRPGAPPLRLSLD